MKPSFYVDIRVACLAVRSLPSSIIDDEFLEKEWPDVVDHFEGYSDWKKDIRGNYPESLQIADQLCSAYNRSMYRWDIDPEEILLKNKSIGSSQQVCSLCEGRKKILTQNHLGVEEWIDCPECTQSKKQNEPDPFLEFLKRAKIIVIPGEYHICPVCKNIVGNFRDRRSEEEFEISGLCQSCQDMIFGQTGSWGEICLPKTPEKGVIV